MARIRTIKPEFFTSEDIVGLSPLARLLYIALWCEADREGRLVWKPKTFKLRYLPADNCDIDALCDELLEAGLIVQYGNGLATIPAFLAHQHINPRESASQLPEPDASSTRKSRVTHASARDSDAQGGREGKGKERKEEKLTPPAKPAAMPELPDWVPAEAWAGFVAMRRHERHSLTPRAARLVLAELGKLRAAGQDPGAVLDQSTRNGWRDVFPLREAKLRAVGGSGYQPIPGEV